MTASAANPQRKRGTGSPFQPGQSGNPKGRAKGSRNRASILADALMEGEAEDVVRAVISAAKAGDPTAMRLVIERIAPVRRGRPVSIDLPPVETAHSVSAAMGRLVDLMAAGEVTPEEASTVATVLESRRKAIEVADLEKRIEALEARNGQGD